MSRMLPLVTAIVCLTGTAIAQEEAAVPGISTSGTAVVTVAPDSVRLVFRLSVEAATHEQAKEKLPEADQSFRQALEGLGIEGLQVESGPFEVKAYTRQGGSSYGRGGGFGGVIRGGGAGGNPQAGEDEPESHYASRQVAVSLPRTSCAASKRSASSPLRKSRPRQSGRLSSRLRRTPSPTHRPSPRPPGSRFRSTCRSRERPSRTTPTGGCRPVQRPLAGLIRPQSGSRALSLYTARST